jgi:hypothetical protein
MGNFAFTNVDGLLNILEKEENKIEKNNTKQQSLD